MSSLQFEPMIAAERVPALDIRSGTLAVRLADTARDVAGSQGLAQQLLDTNAARAAVPQSVIGTYRLIRRSAAARIGRFYSAEEYDISTMVAYPGEILELGRSCVDAAARNRPTMQLLWRGIAAYVFSHQIDL